jgi:hypothetical protein
MGDMLTCSIPGCDRPQFSSQLCISHYRKRGRPDATAPIRPQRERGDSERVLCLSLSKTAAEQVRKEAERTGESEHAVLVIAVEHWATLPAAQKRAVRKKLRGES